ncbi:DUF349 domain-containing protein [Halomonas sp.]|jgi:hypothetical protein|uniref:DUF349 domain-containing protein n=1 Tax=Halomonas sp. TaxID=1486246 RepID=UPI003563CE46
MSGLLRRLFAPRWQHPDDRVRRQTALRLDTGRADQLRILERLALDSDPGVRQTALDRLEDPESLLSLLDDEGASLELRARLVALLTGLQGNLDLATRIALTERLEESGLLSEIALHGDNQQLRLAALARLDDEDDLIRQACDNGIVAVRHAAAARVSSEDGLARLAQSARRDRQVMRQARERLNRRRANAASLAAIRERREALLQSLERHAKASWEPLYAGRFRHLEREWNHLEDLPDASQEQRYQEACQRCRKVIGDHEASQLTREADHRRREDADLGREALVEALEESLDALSRSESINEQDIASLRAHKQLLANRWQALSDQHLADESLRQRYDKALAGYERIAQAWVRLGERVEAIEQALADGDNDRLNHLIDACGWPEDLSPSPLLSRARKHLSVDDLESPDLEARLARFADDLDQLERLLESGAFKGASRLHQRLRQAADQLPADALPPYQARLKRLGAQLAELRDWRGFVAGPKRDHLCQAIASLADDRTLTESDLDRRHRQLVKEWASLGDAAANREQSKRFRTASDQIHQRLAPWRERLDAQRQQNLEAREALCEQLETLLTQPAGEADPDALREIRGKAREQWRQLSPVPRDRAETIGRRFGRIRHDLQALIDRRAGEIADAKSGLIEQARHLLESDIPVDRRAEESKRLQARWRSLGRAPRGEEQTLWREFRSLCDAIFASREAERDDRARRTQEWLEAMQALIDRLDAWQPTTPQEARVLQEAIDEASHLEPLPSGRRTEGMRRRWSGIIRARRERLARLDVIEEVNRWYQVRPLLSRHLEADAASLDNQPAGDVELPAGNSLPEDMRSAHDRRNAARRQPPEPGQVEERLARLRVHLSLLATGRVNHGDDPLRLAIQVERPNENLGREPSRAEELHGVLSELIATGPILPALWNREVGELDRLLERLAQLPPP